MRSGGEELRSETIETAIALGPDHEESIATVAESLEDLGERE